MDEKELIQELNQLCSKWFKAKRKVSFYKKKVKSNHWSSVGFNKVTFLEEKERQIFKKNGLYPYNVRIEKDKITHTHI